MFTEVIATTAGAVAWPAAGVAGQLAVAAAGSIAGHATAAISVLAGDAPSGGVNTQGVVTFVATKIVPIVLAVIGLFITGKSAKGNWSEAISTSGIAILGLIFIGGAFLLFAFGDTLARTIFGA